MWLSQGPGPNSKCSKTVEVRLSARDHHWRNPRKKIIERAAQCHAKEGRPGRLGLQRISAPNWNQTQVIGLSATCLYHSAIDSCQSTEKNSIFLFILLEVFHNLQLLFCLQDCRSWIAQVEYQGQARNTRILERKPLIDTSYRIRHRLELKYFHLAHFLLIAHWVIDLEKVRTDNLKFTTDFRDLVMDGWSVTQ